MVNPYIWQLYLKSGGDKIVETFKDNLTHKFTKDYVDLIKELRGTYTVDPTIIENEYKYLTGLCNDYHDIIFDENPQNLNEEDLDSFFMCYILEDEKYDEKKRNYYFCDFIFNIVIYSTELTFNSPELYFPYHFQFNYNVLQIISDTFSIKLPELPQKSDYEGRLFYYLDLCEALHEFRKENKWSPFELFAFLYDFAPKYIGGISSYIVNELPEPKSAYFIGADKDDENLSSDKSVVSFWQCNPDTKVGDMIVMYLRTPISSIDSVWRSCSVGFIDPFFYYYRCTYICDPVKMDRINYEQMKSDKIIGTMPIVRKNMQGLNGVELKPSEYNHILDSGKCKALRLEYSAIISDNEYSTEKEVEDNVIKPLLKKIGYNENDYVQQLYLEIGNHNHALIPDFVLLPQIKGSYKSAFAVIEAKRSITSTVELDAAKSQVRSYAKLLGTKYASVISQEKIWVFSASDDYTKDIFSHNISKLSEDNLFELKKILGQ